MKSVKAKAVQPSSAIRERPDIYADRLSVLSAEERARLRVFLVDPLYLKLLRIVAVFKPSPNCVNCGSGARDAFSDARANARLGEIRGWELHEAAIFLALNDPPKIKQAAQETFPDDGRSDADWNRPTAIPAEPSANDRDQKRQRR